MRLELERELSQTVREIYSETVHFARTYKEHLDAMRKHVWNTPAYQKAPRWLKTFLHGVDQTLFDSLYSVALGYSSLEPDKGQSPLASISIGPDGRMFGEKDDTWLAEDHAYKTALQCEHVWRARWNRGEFKPF